MDLTELPAPPADPYESYQELPGLFGRCANYLASHLGLPPRVVPADINADPEAFLTAWLGICIDDLDPPPSCRPEQLRQITFTRVPSSYMIAIPRGITYDQRQLIIKLFADPSSGRSDWRGAATYNVSEWLQRLLEFLRDGYYTIESAP